VRTVAASLLVEDDGFFGDFAGVARKSGLHVDENVHEIAILHDDALVEVGFLARVLAVGVEAHFDGSALRGGAIELDHA
jgi:hypothetical protein